MESIYENDKLLGEVITTKDPFKMLAQMLVDGSPDRLEKAIKKTYCKEEASFLITIINDLMILVLKVKVEGGAI